MKTSIKLKIKQCRKNSHEENQQQLLLTNSKVTPFFFKKKKLYENSLPLASFAFAFHHLSSGFLTTAFHLQTGHAQLALRMDWKECGADLLEFTTVII